MTSRPPAPDEERLRRNLHLIADHPWADIGFFQVLGGSSRYQLEQIMQLALSRRLIEEAAVPGHRPGRPPPRLGLTPAGAQAAGRTFEADAWRQTLLETSRLDPARLLLARLHEAHGLLWSFSPFRVPPKAIFPVATKPKKKSILPKKPFPRFVPIPLEALACVQVPRGEPGYANVAILVDPGGIALSWYADVFRSLLAWRNRPEFQSVTGLAPRHAFPIVILIAANADRQAGLGTLWRQTVRANYVRRDMAGPFLRSLTRGELVAFDRAGMPPAEWRWHTEQSQSASLWHNVKLATEPSARPLSAEQPWWGDRAMSAADAGRILGLKYRKASRVRYQGIVAAAGKPPHAAAKKPQMEPRKTSPKTSQKQVMRSLVKNHLELSAVGRWLLDRIGLYPLIEASDLAIVLGLEVHNFRRELQDLQARGLAEQAEDQPGYGLSWRGLSQLAYQAGFDPPDYARLRCWAVATDAQGQMRLSLQGWLACREHTETILAFLAGIRRYGQHAHLTLAQWDHTPWPVSFPSTGGRPQQLTPDARGLVRTLAQPPTPSIQTPFWLEVDRATLEGTRLRDKLAHYYTVGGPSAGVYGRAERLLILVPADDEARLLYLRRRLLELDAFYHTRLDVRLARLDQLADGRGRLDPTRHMWRTLHDSAFVAAFNEAEPLP